jgi:NAD+-dependent protein deacetylase sirtuin 4
MSPLRIPYTQPFPPAVIFPKAASSVEGAIESILGFFTAPPSPGINGHHTVILSGAGISVASGLSDYRGDNGTYVRNKSYRPTYYHEFVTRHEARKRYWARSYVGWPGLLKSRPNSTHHSIAELGKKGYVSSVITQNVDSFHPAAHPSLPTIELHGFLRSVICINCHNLVPRDDFQQSLTRLNPAWADFLGEMLEAGALDTNNREEQRRRGLKINPDGDVDLPHAPYSNFRYPACPHCLEHPPLISPSKHAPPVKAVVETEPDGAWSAASTAGILKPAVIMFGESTSPAVRSAAEEAIDDASRLLIMGSSLATYSAYRLVERARKRGMAIGIINVGGVRNESQIFGDLLNEGLHNHVRCDHRSEAVLPEVASRLDRT